MSSAITWLDTGRRSAQARTQLLAARHITDVHAAAASSALTSIRGLESTQAPLDHFLSELAGLGAIRTAVDSGAQTPVGAFNAYAAIDTARSAFYAAGTPPGDSTLSLMNQAGIAGDQAEGLTAGAVAIVNGAIAADGRMTQAEQVLLAEVVGQQQLKVGETLSLAPAALAPVFRNVFGSRPYQDLVATENQILATPAGAFNAYTAIDTAESGLLRHREAVRRPLPPASWSIGGASRATRQTTLTAGRDRPSRCQRARHMAEMTQPERVLLAEAAGQQQLKVGETLSSPG